MIIRNDDVASDTNLEHLKAFCAVCDKHGWKILHAVTPEGICVDIESGMKNGEIIGKGAGRSLSQRPDLVSFLASRNDLVGAHGYYHTHEPSLADIEAAVRVLTSLGLAPTYFVPPFNEGEYADIELAVSAADADKIENRIAYGEPQTTEIGYLHSWRFDPDCHRIFKHPQLKRQLTLDDLDRWLAYEAA